MKRIVARVLTIVFISVLVGCRPDPTEVEQAERARIIASYEQLLRERETEWVRTVGRGMSTVLAIRVAPGAHDTARTAVALIIDDVISRDDGDGIKALEVLLETDATRPGEPEPYVATWVENGRIERALRGTVPTGITEGLSEEELVFEVAGSDDNRRITLRLYHSTDELETLLAEQHRRHIGR